MSALCIVYTNNGATIGLHVYKRLCRCSVDRQIDDGYWATTTQLRAGSLIVIIARTDRLYMYGTELVNNIIGAPRW